MDPRLLVRHLQLAATAACLPVAALAQTAAAPETTPLQAVRRELSPDALFYTYIDFEGGWGQVGRELSDTLKGSRFPTSQSISPPPSMRSASRRFAPSA